MISFAAMFRDVERRETSKLTAEEEVKVEFAAPAWMIRQRLDVLGYTVDRARMEIERGSEQDSAADNDQLDAWIRILVDNIDEDWAEVDEVPSVTADPPLVVRRLLEEAPDDVEFALDISELVNRGIVEAPGDLCRAAFEELHADSRLFGPLVVLTEGSSDAEFLRNAVEILSPHLSEYVTFLDYYSNRPEGGVDALVRAVKAFAAAGIGNRIVAVFDYDTAAADALATLDESSLPRNFRVVRLPDLNLAAAYPTLGPTGESTWDINGLACSLEMYLGRDVLADGEDHLMPVQWKGYNMRLRQYQGELLDKGEIQRRFRAKVARAREGDGESGDWEALRQVLVTVLEPF